MDENQTQDGDRDDDQPDAIPVDKNEPNLPDPRPTPTPDHCQDSGD
jgi:hypothetical protein